MKRGVESNNNFVTAFSTSDDDYLKLPFQLVTYWELSVDCQSLLVGKPKMVKWCIGNDVIFRHE